MVTTGRSLDGPDTAPAPAAHILVMDDDRTIRDVLEGLLKMLGHTVSQAIDGEEAIGRYRDAHQRGDAFGAVIVDLTVPGGMGGQQAAQEILKMDPQARIIVSSGYPTDPVMADHEHYGFKSSIVKPFRFEELRTAIRQALEA